MSKFTPEERIQIAKRYLEGNESFKSIAESLGISKNNIVSWVKLLQNSGEESFKSTYTSYSAEYKLRIINYMAENGLSLSETAGIFGISSPGLISNWRTIYEKEGYDSLLPKKKGRPSMTKGKHQKIDNKKKENEKSKEDLIEEIEQLRMENAYLKKLNALVQKKERSQKKKR